MNTAYHQKTRGQAEAAAGARTPLPRWACAAIAVPTALAVAAGIALFNPAARNKIQSIFHPSMGMSGEEDPRRANIVGLRLDLDGVSAANLAAITESSCQRQL